MHEKRVLFDRFEFPVIKGLDYLLNEESQASDYLFINEPHDKFSMYFEVGQKPFSLSETATENKDYCLLELNRKNRKICFYCPERVSNRESVMWYFYVELFDENGVSHCLPGQIRLAYSRGCLRIAEERTQFIEVLEQVRLKTQNELA